MNTYATYSDEQLLALIRESSEIAFKELYSRYSLALIDTGFYYTQDKEAIEEIINDIFLRIWRGRHKIEIHSFKEYLGTAVKFGVFKTLLKEKRRRNIIANHPVISSADNIIDKIETRFKQDYLDGIVESLPEKTKLIFKYSREDQLSVDQIAETMDMQPKAVEYHITKSLKILRSAFYDIEGARALIIIAGISKCLFPL